MQEERVVNGRTDRTVLATWTVATLLVAQTTQLLGQGIGIDTSRVPDSNIVEASELQPLLEGGVNLSQADMEALIARVPASLKAARACGAFAEKFVMLKDRKGEHVVIVFAELAISSAWMAAAYTVDDNGCSMRSASSDPAAFRRIESSCSGQALFRGCVTSRRVPEEQPKQPEAQEPIAPWWRSTPALFALAFLGLGVLVLLFFAGPAMLAAIMALATGLASRAALQRLVFANHVALSRWLGQGVAGAQTALAALLRTGKVPEGLSRLTLLAYRELLRRQIIEKFGGVAPEVMRIRMQIFDEALKLLR